MIPNWNLQQAQYGHLPLYKQYSLNGHMAPGELVLIRQVLVSVLSFFLEVA